MAYFGPPAGAVDFLSELHYECPPFINPTDFISKMSVSLRACVYVLACLGDYECEGGMA